VLPRGGLQLPPGRADNNGDTDENGLKTDANGKSVQTVPFYLCPFDPFDPFDPYFQNC
jgi:hypothetical protein